MALPIRPSDPGSRPFFGGEVAKIDVVRNRELAKAFTQLAPGLGTFPALNKDPRANVWRLVDAFTRQVVGLPPRRTAAMSDSSQPEIEAPKAALLDFMSQAVEGQRDIRQLILQLGSSVDAIGSSFADVAQNAKALRSEMTDLRVQLMARIDRLQTRMDGVRDDITTPMTIRAMM